MTDRDDQPMGRRGFLRDAMARVVRPLASYLEERVSSSSPVPTLRPPGAIDEARFLETCFRCGNCVTACPATAIFLLSDSAGVAAGTPVIDPSAAPCVVCEGLHCTSVCASNALVTLIDPRAIRMGVAEVYEPLCLRTQGDACTICVDHCPMGPEAILFPDEGAPTVLPDGCVGCGVCQHHCPTTPKAIVVQPSPTA